MKIIRISVWQKDLRLREPYCLSGGRLQFETLDSTFVRIDTDAGISGWGEGCPWGHTYLPAHGPGIRAGIETMAQVILGLDPCAVEHVERAIDVCLPGHLYAKAPIDTACWDIMGRAFGRPVADLLGGRRDSGTPIASSISSGSSDYMTRLIEKYRERGYFVHSVKVGADELEDIKNIRALEALRRPNEIMFYDANRAWTRRQANIAMNAVADLGVTFEQPCETLDDIAALRKVTTSPISIDESLVTLQDMVRIARDGLADCINIKINRVGGLTKAKRIRDVAMAHGIQMYVMATGGSVMADTEAAHLAQSTPEEFCLATWACQDMLTIDVAASQPEHGGRSQDGLLTVSDAPGFGIEPDVTVLGEPVAVYE